MEELGLLVPSDLEGQLVPLDLRVTLVILAQRAIRVFEDPLVPLAPRALPDLRAMLANADQKDLGVFRVPLDQLAVALEEPQFLVPKAPVVPLVLRDLGAIKVFRVPLDPLVLPEPTGKQDPRAIMVRLVPPDLLAHRVLPDLLESVVPLVRMRLPLSWIST